MKLKLRRFEIFTSTFEIGHSIFDIEIKDEGPFRGLHLLFQYFYLLKVLTEFKLVGFIGVYRYFFYLFAIGNNF